MHPELRTICYKHLVESKLADLKSPSALWASQLALLCKKDPANIKWCFIDNFYARHHLGEVIKLLTEGKCKITGTQRLNLVDATNKNNVKKAMDLVEKMERGS